MESRPRWWLIGRTLAFIASAALALLAAGCGGSSKAPSVASLAPTTSRATSSSQSSPSTRPSRAAFAACLTSHGFPGSSGSASGGNTIFGVSIGIVDPGSRQFQAALQACRKFLPGGGPPALTPAQRAEAAKAMASFAACMRKNGVSSFPDPNGRGTFPLGSLDQLDSNSPLFQTAYKACQSLMPKVGPRIGF